jgi:methionine-rich copper-binding protein CopC
VVSAALAALAAVAGLFGAGLFGAEPVGAHTDLIQGSPGPGQRVGGDVDFVDLVFGAVVTEAIVEVKRPDGTVAAGEMVVADGQIIRHRLEASLTEAGRYLVEYQMVSDDGDPTARSYFFDYDPDAAAPTRLGAVDVPGEPVVTTRNVIGAVAVLALVVACTILVLRLRRSRAQLAAQRAEHVA